jgi:hypothetical protein
MDIGGVLALAILTMVSLNFVRTALWEAMFLQNLAHAGFMLSKISYSTKPTIILHFSMTAAFWLWPTVEICGTARLKHCITIEINWSHKQFQVGRVCKNHHSHVGIILCRMEETARKVKKMPT